MAENKKRRSGIAVMAGLIGMIRPLLGYMIIAIIMGCIGNLMATFITILGGYGFLSVFGVMEGVNLTLIFVLLVAFAVLRGVLRYAEQACNHFIAFKLLARIRHKVFAALRKLAPAKLDGSEKGNLISIITSDIELLEVFYAHTISPIAIAIITSVFMVCFLGNLHVAYGVLGFVFYVIVGVVIPLVNGKMGGAKGQQYRNSFGELNTCVLDNLYGLEEIIEYAQQDVRQQNLNERTQELGNITEKLKKDENIQRVITDGVILFAGIAMAILGAQLVNTGQIFGAEAIIAVIAMTSSFGPTAALSALSNNLHHTLASGNRVLDILEEAPVVEDVTNGVENIGGDINCQGVEFSYKAEDTITVLNNFSATFAENKIHGILGKSGCGKSTLLKLLMRFYETESGEIKYGIDNVNDINTNTLRNNISYVTQETFLFTDTIANNIRVAKEDATMEEIIEAAKKASIHDFIMSTPEGYDTKLAELGDSISGGEKQRIGIARAFLHDSKMIFLDEPTSNIDSLNEGMILRSLDQEKKNKTILLVSHRKSTMGIADDVIAM
ncbi:MAG: ABC transporter ATP-binding protein [Agathobacter sp.]|nr:ABC transporter ATP-binding protein [Agathobacter sp.]